MFPPLNSSFTLKESTAKFLVIYALNSIPHLDIRRCAGSKSTGTSSPPNWHGIVKAILGSKDIHIVMSNLVPAAEMSSSRLLSVLRPMTDWVMLVGTGGSSPWGDGVMP